jgi:hypothetical protein
MKLLKTLTLGAAIALTGATAASAATPTIVHVAGSTAFRSGACAAIVDYLSGHLAAGSSNVYATGYLNNNPTSFAGGSEPKNVLGLDAVVLANGTLGSGGTATIVFETYWTGSLAGLVDLAVGSAPTSAYIDITNSTVQTSLNGNTVNTTSYASNGYTAAGSPTSGTYNGYLGYTQGTGASTVATVASAPDFIFSDSYYSTITEELGQATLTGTITSPTGTFTNINQLINQINNNATEAGGQGQLAAGVVPFEWVLGYTGGTGTTTINNAISNIGQQTANALVANGYVSQSALSGATNPSDNYFYLVGRNEDSGTRIDSLAEIQFGVVTDIFQYYVPGYAGNPAGVNATKAGYFPKQALNTEPTISWNALGNSGYATGADVRTALNSTVSLTGTSSMANGTAGNTGSNYFIGYVGISDANNVVINPPGSLAAKSGAACKALTYNGVAYSPTTVENGSYTDWGYEHIYYLPSNANATLINAIADQVYLHDADVASNGTHGDPAGSNFAGAGGILIGDMLVQRPVTEGQNISANNP